KRRRVLTKVEDAAPELCAVARSGLMSLVGRPDGPPIVLGGHVVYSASGLYVGVATAVALLQRQMTGRSTTTTVSVLECLESLMEQAMIEYTFAGNSTERRGSGGQ